MKGGEKDEKTSQKTSQVYAWKHQFEEVSC